jgi:hypothetical protein
MKEIFSLKSLIKKAGPTSVTDIKIRLLGTFQKPGEDLSVPADIEVNGKKKLLSQKASKQLILSVLEKILDEHFGKSLY